MGLGSFGYIDSIIAGGEMRIAILTSNELFVCAVLVAAYYTWRSIRSVI